jgi:hypothetical protein
MAFYDVLLREEPIFVVERSFGQRSRKGVSCLLQMKIPVVMREAEPLEGPAA